MRIRNTAQKEQVRAALESICGHPTVDEVYEQVRGSVPNISRATVYRILNQMADSGLISRLRLPDFANRYDRCTVPHHHAQCVNCGRVFDVELSSEPQLDYSKIKADGLKILGHNLIFEAICPECGGQS